MEVANESVNQALTNYKFQSNLLMGNEIMYDRKLPNL
jgi:hypothetical protein